MEHVKLVIRHTKRSDKLLFDARISRHDDQWIGVVDAIGVSTYGDDKDLVAEDLIGLTAHFLNSVNADGELERIIDRYDIDVLDDAADDQVADHQQIADDEPSILHQWVVDVKDFATVASS
ncbi:MAG: hypothetical protein OXR64_09805 [Chloroflexota bacterium]|nr:hypothetical protein [Chloroflexota bacterium]MDE2920126.1 hypothetical protein [Chloroflexota bacterium]